MLFITLTPVLAALFAVLGGLIVWKRRTKMAKPADLRGKVAIVTGANVGLGKETSAALAVMGAHVILACRDEGRATEAIRAIKEEFGDSLRLEYMHLNLTSLDSVRAFEKAFAARKLPLHILVNNAGVVLLPFALTSDGYEQHWQANYLGHFLLTYLLVPHLKRAAPSRIVSASSFTHANGTVLLSAMQFKDTGYNRVKAYANSKLALVMMSFYISKLLSGTGVSVHCADPGTAATNVTQFLAYKWCRAIADLFVRTFFRTPRQGAQTGIYCACAPELEGVTGSMYANCGETRAAPQVYDEEKQRELWERTCQQLKISPSLL